MPTDRRRFLQLLTAGAASGAFPASIARALEIPAHERTHSIRDVEHIVVLMQENRSFDHYYGTLRGVRGYGDPRAVDLPCGDPVWRQPNGSGYVMPFHPGAPNLGLQFLADLAHDWKTTQEAWNLGAYDGWVPAKSTTTMAYLTRSDIPFHYALADAFTICDAYHCSLFGPTDPNRFYMWTGGVGNDGSGGGPVIDNAEAGYSWTTFPERLQAANISWKIYQDAGLGLTREGEWGQPKDPYIGNYGDNALLYFKQYQNAPNDSPLAQRARTGTSVASGGSMFDQFQKDIRAGKLPQVSWIVAPEAYSEHPNWPANYGAWYIAQILDALTAQPEVWSKTAFFLTFDENDGFFDHMVPPTVPPSRAHGLSNVDTKNELFEGHANYPLEKFPVGPYGVGVRVPMTVISPWSKGGRVNSELFDHTSIIRFIERRYAEEHPSLVESNITPWRRAVCGDLTSAFNFATPNLGGVSLPSTSTYAPPDNKRHPDYVPAPPAEQAMPIQERGTRPACALPYELDAELRRGADGKSIELHFRNAGSRAAVFQVRSRSHSAGPWTYTVAPATELADSFPADELLQKFDFSVYGPNGFFRSFQRATHDAGVPLHVTTHYNKDDCEIELTFINLGTHAIEVAVLDRYSKQRRTHVLEPQKQTLDGWQRHETFGWYDIQVTVAGDGTFRHQVAGHIESGQPSTSDPAFGV